MFTAYFIQKKYPDAQLLVLERGAYSLGASTRNAGFACFGSVSELLMDLNHMSAAQVGTLTAQRWQGLHLMRQILEDKQIGYEECGGYEVFRAEDEQLADKCLQNLDRIEKLVSEATGLTEIYSVHEAAPAAVKSIVKTIFNKYEGRLDTGKLYLNLLKLVINAGVKVLNGVHVHEIAAGNFPTVHTSLGKINAGKVLITVNAFAGQFLPNIDIRPVRNQVLVTNPIPDLKLNGCFHMDQGYFYFRNIGERILIGGGRHLLGKTEETAELATTHGGISQLAELMNQVIDMPYPPEIAWTWSGILGIGDQKIPIIRSCEENIYCAVRMGGMGVALSSYAGRELAEMVERSEG